MAAPFDTSSSSPPYSVGLDSLFVAYYASAESILLWIGSFPPMCWTSSANSRTSRTASGHRVVLVFSVRSRLLVWTESRRLKRRVCVIWHYGEVLGADQSVSNSRTIVRDVLALHKLLPQMNPQRNYSGQLLTGFTG